MKKIAVLVAMMLTCAGSSRAEIIRTDTVTINLDGEVGVTSWRLDRFSEDVLGVEVARPGTDMVWRRARIGLGRFPGLGRADAGAQLDGTLLKGDDGRGVVQVVRDASGAILPKEIQATLRWRFEDRYAAVVELELLNTTTDQVDLDDPVRGPVALVVWPLLRDDPLRTEIVAGAPDGSVRVVSPTDERTVVEAPVSWLGARNQYYAFAVQETTGGGRFIQTRMATLERQDATQQHPREFAGVALGWAFGWPRIRGDETLKASFRIFLGPKNEKDLAGSGFEGIFNTWEGWTGPIGKLMFSLLVLLHGVTGNYGWAILLLTLLVKIILHPLNRKQMVAMRKMQELQPKIQELKEKHKDQQRLNQELQKLFTEHQVNPLGGCFPIMLQIPIFVALYTCLSSAIELKGASFLWLPDLSMADPLHLLPVLFAASVYFSSKATSGGDPSQAQMMKIMPIVMCFLFWNLAAGVMLYIAGQSVFSMIEQQYHRLALEGAESPPPKRPKKS